MSEPGLSSAKKKRMISVTSTISGKAKRLLTVTLGGVCTVQRYPEPGHARKPQSQPGFGAGNGVAPFSSSLTAFRSASDFYWSMQFILGGPTHRTSELIF
jgi:hypothetical protein